jgi:type IV pilus assembly protein PilC
MIQGYARSMSVLKFFRREEKVVQNDNKPDFSTSSLFLSYSIKDQILFTKRLAMILRSGMPILTGIRILEESAHSSSAKKIVGSIARDLSHGLSLSNALRKFEKIFGVFTINIIRVGESSGTLSENLEYISQELLKKNELKKKVIGSLIYPFIIVVAMLGITSLLIVFIFPKILPIFLSLKSQLPITTRMLISLSAFLSRDGFYLLGGIIASAFAFTFSMRKFTQFHYVMDRVLVYIPVFGKMSLYYNLSNTCRTISLLLKSDVQIVNAIQIAGDSLKNQAYKRALYRASEAALVGQRVSVYLRKEPHLFPPLMTQMMGVGETTGNLSDALMYISEMYESEINDLTKNLTNMLEPFLMITMGLIVGFIAISIISPIYGITQNLHT